MINGDPRILFAIIALHHLSQADSGLEPEEVKGLQMLLESVIIDGRHEHDGLQKHGQLPEA